MNRWVISIWAHFLCSASHCSEQLLEITPGAFKDGSHIDSNLSSLDVLKQKFSLPPLTPSIQGDGVGCLQGVPHLIVTGYTGLDGRWPLWYGSLVQIPPSSSCPLWLSPLMKKIFCWRNMAHPSTTPLWVLLKTTSPVLPHCARSMARLQQVNRLDEPQFHLLLIHYYEALAPGGKIYFLMSSPNQGDIGCPFLSYGEIYYISFDDLDLVRLQEIYRALFKQAGFNKITFQQLPGSGERLMVLVAKKPSLF